MAGNADEVGRHVLPEAEELLVRSAAASVSVPRTWMKMPAEPEEIESWLPQGWAWEESGHLMAIDLTATDPVAPEGYTTTVETIGAVTYARVLDAAGEQAAQGQMASLGEAVVVDRVVTEEDHRRRGLGNFVMRTLADRAQEEGAVLGVLGATDAGRALYDAGLEEARDAGGVRLPALKQEHWPYAQGGRIPRAPTAAGRSPLWPSHNCGKRGIKPVIALVSVPRH
ncbi:GNAT family N-acetyltransferase [Streptomyces sp. CA2R101]|uniref:GNAT family N-acetyltransferase n=1 Tax=Streptomyces sp. CA2R101 TaxID=3120152 RepID=UPI00300BDD3A